MILDKSLLQAESRACHRLRSLCPCGCTFILTDTLVYELCTGSRETLWSEAQRKLFEFADSIEVWRHTGELLKDELAGKTPVGLKWFACHHARSSLALWCVFMLKYGEKDTPGKEFRNTKLDADYAALLHYADALATNETSGSMADMCSWLYRGSKKLFSTSGLDAVLPMEDRIRLDAYWIWDRSGRCHGYDVADWLLAEKAMMDQIWDRLGVANDSAIAPTDPVSSSLTST